MSSRLLARAKATIRGRAYHDIYKTRVALELTGENYGRHLVEYSGSDVLCWHEHARRQENDLIEKYEEQNLKIENLLLSNFPKGKRKEEGKSKERNTERERAANTDEVSLQII
jgi:hypothetical protein